MGVENNGNHLGKYVDRLSRVEQWDVTVIADYGKGDGAFAEVDHALTSGRSNIVPGWETSLDRRVFSSGIRYVAADSFSTLSTGFWIRQLGVEDGYPGLAIFSNTAPRGTTEAIAWQGDERQRLLYGELDNGVPVVAVSAGFNWSFIRDKLVRLHDMDIPNNGTQFRSRDIYAPAFTRLLAGYSSLIGEELDPTQIPPVPSDRIVYVDGYGNIKLSAQESTFPQSLRAEPKLWVEIEGEGVEVYNHLSGARAPVGGISLTDGSSGPVGDRHLELVLRGGRAADVFGIEERLHASRDRVIRPDERKVTFHQAIATRNNFAGLEY